MRLPHALAILVACALAIASGRALADPPPRAAAHTPSGAEIRFQKTPRWTRDPAPFWAAARDGVMFVGPASLRHVLPGTAVAVTVHLVGANGGGTGYFGDKLPGVSHYRIGDDPALWENDVPAFSGVRFPKAYPGIDVVYKGYEGRLEYAFEVAPGADPRKILLRFDVADGGKKIAASVHVDDAGDLVVTTPKGEVRHARPTFYELTGTERRALAGGFVMKGPADVAFHVEGHDPARALVIDPTVAYVGYAGTAGSDGGLAVASDRLGNSYVAGTVQIGAGQAFVRKLNAGEVVWETYIGGSAAEGARGVAVDAALNVYVAGYTTSSNLPTTIGVFSKNCPKKVGQVNCPNKLGFVGRLSPNGQFAAGQGWLSYLGGTYSDEAWGVAVDTSGEVFVVGDARSIDWPAQHVLAQPHPTMGGVNPTDDAFLAHVTADGTKLDTLIYLGGSDLDYARAVSYSPDGPSTGVLALAGYSYSNDFTMSPGVVQPAKAGLIDAFVTKVYYAPAKLFGLPTLPVISTYLGGADNDLGLSVAVDPDGAVYVAGTTASADFPLSIVQQVAATDGFVTKLSPALDEVKYSRLIGGAGSDSANGVAVDRNGRAHVTGDTTSVDLAVLNCFQCNPGVAQDGFYAALDPDGAIDVLSYVGGAVGGSGLMPVDSGKGITVDPYGGVVLAGTTSSTDLADQLIAVGAPPVTPYNAQSDAFYVGITPCGAPKVDPNKQLANHALVGDFISQSNDVAGVTGLRSTWAGGPNWDVHVGATANDGLVAQDVRLGFNLNGLFCGTDDIKCQQNGYRYMAPRLSVPYFELSLSAQGTNAAQAARCELSIDSISGATQNDWFCRSRLVDLDIHQDLKKLAITATYEVMTEPPPGVGQKPQSCLVVKQSQEFFSRLGSNRCELTARAACNRFRPLVSYKFYPARPPAGQPKNPSLDIRVPQRHQYDPDGKPKGGVSMFGDNHSVIPPIPFTSAITGPILYSVLDKPLPVEARAQVIANSSPFPVQGMMFYYSLGGNFGYDVSTETVDNIHQSAKPGPVEEPKPDAFFAATLPFTVIPCAALVALGYTDCFPHAIQPGCPDCVHMHWRWQQFAASTFYDQFPQFSLGNEILPKGSAQDVTIAYTIHPDPDPQDFQTLAALASDMAPSPGNHLGSTVAINPCNTGNCQSLANSQPIFWYMARSIDYADTFMYHGGWFHADSVVGGPLYASPPPPGRNPLD